MSRVGNKMYDYEDKAEDVLGWRLRNFDAIVNGSLLLHSTHMSEKWGKIWQKYMWVKLFLIGRLRRYRKELLDQIKKSNYGKVLV